MTTPGPLYPARPDQPTRRSPRRRPHPRLRHAHPGSVQSPPHRPPRNRKEYVPTQRSLIPSACSPGRRQQAPLWQYPPACSSPGFAPRPCKPASAPGRHSAVPFLEFMKKLDIHHDGGGPRGIRTLLRNQMDRLFHTQISLIYEHTPAAVPASAP